MNATAGTGGLAGLWRSLSGTRPAAASSAPAPAPAPVPAGVLPIEPTHYQRLGLPEDCTEAEIEIAWHRVAAGLLPPRPPGERLKPPPASAGTAEEARTEQMRSDDRRLARAVLGDPVRRAVYDAWLARERAARPPQGWMSKLRGR